MKRTATYTIAVPLALIGVIATLGAAPRFFTDDPLWTEPSSQDAAGVKPWSIDLVVDLTYNQFGHPGDPTPNVRARNLNSVDEVPDGAWFTNRAGLKPLTPEEVFTGPDTSSGPAPGQWTVTSAKSDGITPGFTIKDSTGQRWFIKFDPPGYRAMATGTEVTVTKLFWALGYHVPQNHIAALRRDQLVIDKDAGFTPPGRKKRPMRLSDVDDLLSRADRDRDGSFRVVASRSLEGQVLGGFRFYGTRPDDPNDTVPHEHRRELRGYGVFAAWFNHVDAKAINTMDTLVKQDGRTIVRHNLLDFGSTLGSGGVGPREDWEGYEYLVQPKDVGKQMVSLGFAVPKWRTVDFYRNRAIGSLPKDNTKWHPEMWRPRVPNAAFLRARADDNFWAATKAAGVTDDMIRAAVRAGQFGDEEAEHFLTKAIIERRDAVVRAYLTAINPVSNPALSRDGRLTFSNAAVDARVAKAPTQYKMKWAIFDNATGSTTRDLGETTSTEPSVEAPQGLPRDAGQFVKVQISATGGAHPSWERPVDAWFTRTSSGWTLVGFERLPNGQPGT